MSTLLALHGMMIIFYCIICRSVRSPCRVTKHMTGHGVFKCYTPFDLLLSRRMLSLGHGKGYIHKRCDTALYYAGPEMLVEKKKYSHDDTPPGKEKALDAVYHSLRGQGQAVTARASCGEGMPVPRPSHVILYINDDQYTPAILIIE